MIALEMGSLTRLTFQIIFHITLPLSNLAWTSNHVGMICQNNSLTPRDLSRKSI